MNDPMFGPLIDELHPKWARHVLASTLPEDTLVCYSSRTQKADDANPEAKVLVLAITPGWLMRLQVTSAPSEYGGSKYTVDQVSLPLDSILSWFSSVVGESEGYTNFHIYERVLQINLDRDLGDMGREVRLPLSREDYAGDISAALEAVARFRNVLQTLQPSGGETPPRIGRAGC